MEQRSVSELSLYTFTVSPSAPTADDPSVSHQPAATTTATLTAAANSRADRRIGGAALKSPDLRADSAPSSGGEGESAGCTARSFPRMPSQSHGGHQHSHSIPHSAQSAHTGGLIPHSAQSAHTHPGGSTRSILDLWKRSDTELAVAAPSAGGGPPACASTSTSAAPFSAGEYSPELWDRTHPTAQHLFNR